MLIAYKSCRGDMDRIMEQVGSRECPLDSLACGTLPARLSLHGQAALLL